MNNKILLLLAGILLCLPLYAQYRFSFHKDGKFKIAQFTDIHWAPQSANCSITASTIESVLQAEQPDIAILTGDVVTDSPALEGWKSIIQIFEKAQMPFAVLMGNHDAENMSKDSIYLLLSASPYFVGDRGPVDIKGYGNSIIPIYDSQKQSTIHRCCIVSTQTITRKIRITVTTTGYILTKLTGIAEKVKPIQHKTTANPCRL